MRLDWVNTVLMIDHAPGCSIESMVGSSASAHLRVMVALVKQIQLR